ncbi:serine/threonine protein kinase [Streptomyces tateyamensis]|uniref:Serine/threonine protein kinase n=1 Tax=Streptomyces tateyamensis TaxID=565073 RepID=A0A2V4NTH4_9ACTN|nr:serine/threonine-protein kinase [Streptomyces tateyamensis]PYC66655.1 serine/threonine protein kinase [Streptomyces tateyamensis]
MEPLDSTDPEAIGPYRLIARLGVGGMGRVYLARSAGGRTVAVKVVRGELAGDQEFLTRFGREVAAARAVDGTYTAPVVDAEVSGAQPWLATAYVLGPSLTDAVGRYGPLPEHSVRALGVGLAQALRAVHAAGLVHRDLKPSNVLLAADGPRVIDFGIARAMDGDQMTRTGVVVGSPGYMSPEQAAGLAMTPASDVFSLGSVLLYAACGHGPFESESGPAAQLYRVVHDQADLGELPASLREAVGACLAKEPARRPTPEQLSAMLAPDGPDSLLRDGWLPVPVASALARHAAAVMDLEAPVRNGSPAPAAQAAYSPTTTDGHAVADPGTMQLGGAAGPPGTTGGPGTVQLGAAQHGGGAPTLPQPAAPGPKPSRRNLLVAGGGVLALAAAGGIGWALSGHGGKPVAGGSTSPSPAPDSAASTGTVPLPAPTATRADGVPPGPLWTYPAKGRLGLGPAQFAGGLLLPPGDALVALDPASGKEQWARRDVQAIEMAAHGNDVYVSALGGAAGYDLRTSAPNWQSANRSTDNRTINANRLLGVDDKHLYLLADLTDANFASTSGVLAFALDTKQVAWFQERKKGTDTVFISSMVAGGNVFYTDADANLVARGGATGQQLWFADTGAKAAFQPAADDTQAYCLVGGTGLQAVRLSDGVQQWKIQLPAGQLGMFTPVTASGGVVYGSDGSASVSAWSAKDGTKLWTCPLPRSPSGLVPPVLVHDTLFVPGKGDEGLYAVDTKHAKVRWTFKNGLNTGDDWYLSTDGERLFAVFQSTVYCLPPV